MGYVMDRGGTTMKYKYAVTTEFFPNCRGCDIGYPNKLRFYSNFHEMLNDALQDKEDFELSTVYSLRTGEELAQFNYHTSKHRCHGVSIQIRNKKFKTVDNGHGKLIWVCE
jgi:hypothetical protein